MPLETIELNEQSLFSYKTPTGDVEHSMHLMNYEHRNYVFLNNLNWMKYMDFNYLMCLERNAYYVNYEHNWWFVERKRFIK